MRFGVLTLLLAASAAAQDYARDIAPIFARHCVLCHGPDQQQNGLRLDHRDAALRGGYSGAVIVPGSSAASPLIQRVTSAKKDFMMPPVGPRLTVQQIALLRKWIDAGAQGPTEAAPAANTKSSHWAFQPIRRPPAASIDSLILARLKAEGLASSPEADRATLLRRVTLDLTGLPPAPHDVAAFLADTRPDAYQRLVDRLMNSPQYGERWARPWLDLAHYADSDGYEKDLPRPWSWRWRQWVIDALNRDLPFDQFTTEQLAGDLLPNPTLEQRVATGFLRQTLTNREAGVSREEIRFEQLVDRTNTTATTWLGLTVGCAQCHNHKYDPISQKDFYRFLTYFHQADEEDIDAPMPGELGPHLAARAAFDRQRAEILSAWCVADYQTAWERGMREAIAHPGRKLDWDFWVTELRAGLDHFERMLLKDPAQRTRREQDRLTRYFLQRLPDPDLQKNKAAMEKLREARKKLDALDATLPALTQAMTMAENPAPGPSHLRLRGDPRQKGIAVDAGTLEVLAPLKDAPANRLGLARWLVSRENPLTARVTVNRIWQELFGKGLVRTSEDFGTQGEKPSHPELLDWLAAELQAPSNGERPWSLKHIVRLIVTSATYRQSSAVRPELAERDPENRLLARQSRLRLPAELIRDQALAASGLLYTAVGGISVRPPQPKGVAELGYANSVKWPESAGKDRYRRGLYIHFQRTVPYPYLMNFDGPDSVTTCSRRRTSNTPLQALNLLNDPVFFEAAQALALRVLSEVPPPERLDHAMLLTLGRQPSAAERARLLKYIADQRALLENDTAAAGALAPPGADFLEAATWTAVSRVLLNLDEFVTRE